MLDKMRWIRVLGFAAVYFCIYASSMIYFTIRSLPHTPEYSGYFQDPWTAINTILGYAVFELPRQPLMTLALFILIAQSFILGFVTDWGLRILKRSIQPRRAV